MKRLFIKNAAFSILGRGWSIILGFIITPYIISRIGVEQFGVWILIESIVAYFVLLDMGFGTSFNKYIADYHARKEYAQLSNIFTVGMLFYLLFSLLLIAVSLSFQNWIIKGFNFGNVPYDDVFIVYIAFILILCLRAVTTVFSGIITGLLRYDILNKIRIFSSTVNFIGIYLFLSFGYRLKGLALNGVIYAVLDLIIFTIASYKLVPQIKFAVHRGLKTTFASLFKFGMTLQVVSLAELINEQIDKILLGILRSASYVGLYEVGAKISNIANMLPSVILPILNPTASNLNAMSKKEEVNDLYIRGTKLVAVITFPIAAIVIVHAEHIVSFWMNRTDMTAAAAAARFLIIGVSSYLIVGVGRMIARGIGMPHYEMQAGILIGISNFIMSYLMIVKWGLYGAVIASSSTLLMGSIFFLVRFNKKMGLPQKMTFKMLFAILLFSGISILPSLAIQSFYDIYTVSSISVRMQSFIYLMLVSITTAFIYIPIVYISGIIKEEIKLFR